MSLATIVARPAFWADAACLTRESQQLVAQGRANWFPEQGRSSGLARDVCADCPVRRQCLDFANSEPFLRGLWGGFTEGERRRMRERGAA